MLSPEPENCQIGIRTPLESKNYFQFLSQTIGVDGMTFLSRMQSLVKIGKELWA